MDAVERRMAEAAQAQAAGQVRDLELPPWVCPSFRSVGAVTLVHAFRIMAGGAIAWPLMPRGPEWLARVR